jgi:hypothetical protein
LVSVTASLALNGTVKLVLAKVARTAIGTVKLGLTTATRLAN